MNYNYYSKVFSAKIITESKHNFDTRTLLRSEENYTTTSIIITDKI